MSTPLTTDGIHSNNDTIPDQEPTSARPLRNIITYIPPGPGEMTYYDSSTSDGVRALHNKYPVISSLYGPIYNMDLGAVKKLFDTTDDRSILVLQDTVFTVRPVSPETM